MDEQIITLLSKKGNMSLSLEDIAKKLEIKNIEELKEKLNKMVRFGILDYSPKKNKYLLFENSHLYMARLSYDRLGNGIVKIDDREIVIPKKSLRGASYHDLVAVDYSSKTNYGVVVRIIERDNSNYVGEVKCKNNQLYVESKQLGVIPISSLDDTLVEGHRVLIHHFDGKSEVVSVIGHKDDPGVDLQSILYENGIIDVFSEQTLKELDDIPTILTDQVIEEELLNGRVDFRDRKIVTIDSSHTKDIDDAISIRKLANGCIELGVYIADVSYYIKEGSFLDQEAYERGTSVYPPGSVVPQFPHKISNGICSLNPNQDRLAMCYFTTFDPKGNVVDFNLMEGIIRSSKKMTYEDVNCILENEEMVEGYEDFQKELYLMEKLSLLIRKKLLCQGSLDFITTEGQIELDDQYRAIGITKRQNRTAEGMIENFMLITNMELTKYAYYLGLPWIYRVHGLPNQDRLVNTFDILRHHHYISDKERRKKYNTNDLQKAIKELENRENAEIFYKMLIISQDKAKYSVDNIGHFAVGAEYYSHNTSPIRRGPDLTNQRILKCFLHEGLEEAREKYGDLYEQAGHYSARERAAERCERDATNMKKAEYMEQFVGEVFSGYISYVNQYGFFVLLDNTVEGFVSIHELPKDKYSYNEELLSLNGKKYCFAIGDKVEVMVKHTDKDKKAIDFSVSLKEYQKDEEKGKKKIKVR